MAVLPTPGSPISTGLFFVRRDRTCMTRSISFSRPMTGSSFGLARQLGEVPAELVEDHGPLRLLLAGLALALARVAGQELDDLLANPAEVGAELLQDLRGDALALADQPEQDVLGADVVVPELQRLAERQLQDLLRPRRERDVAGGRRLALADDVLDLGADGLERDVHGLERLRGDALALVDQPEQEVLGADVVVVEHPRLFLREDHDPPGSVGEALEHVYPLGALDAPPVGSASGIAGLRPTPEATEAPVARPVCRDRSRASERLPRRRLYPWGPTNLRSHPFASSPRPARPLS